MNAGHKSKSPRSYPSLVAHITLASPIPSSLSTATILSSVPARDLRGDAPLQVRFKSIDVGDTYWRSVYITIDPTPEMLKLRDDIHAALRKHEGVNPTAPHFPHMSLYYIDDSEPDERNVAKNRLFTSKQAEEYADGVKLGNLPGFEGAEIWVVRCEGPVEEWEVLGKMDY